MLILIGAALLHEVAHILSMLIFKVKINELRIMPFGIKIVAENSTQINYKKDMIIALSGPFINLISAVIIYICGQFFFMPAVLGFIFIVNLSLFIINILPIYPLDGGRALKALLMSKIDIERAERISLRISAILILPLLFAGFWLLSVTEYNFTLILIAIYLLICLYRQIKTDISI